MAVPDDLHSLIAELERVLWEGQLSENQEVSALLERVRYYLLTSQSSNNYENYEQRVEKLTEIILARLETHITHWLKPLGNDLDNLRYQRQSLLQEIQQLERQRQQMMSVFLDRLTHSCTQVIQQQISQTLDNRNPLGEESETTTDSGVSSANFSKNLASNLDSSLQKIFASLEQDLHDYCDSLSEGLERMHNLGQQGEVKFLAHFNRLQQQLETTLRQPILESSNPQATSILRDSNQKWYLGLDLSSQDLTSVLWQVKGNNTEEPLIYPLEETFDLASSLTSLDLSLKESWKQVLMGLKEAVSRQIVNFAQELNESFDGDFRAELTGIMVICPGHSNGYNRTELQEVILESNLVSNSEQIIWVDRAIALALTLVRPGQKIILLLGVEESVTQFALVKVQDPFSSFITKGLNYGLTFLEQDILCQLIYPQWESQIPQTLPHFPQPFPQSGYPDLLQREILSKQLQNHPLGDAFLEAARLTRFIIQQQDSFTSTLNQQSWGITRQELVEKVVNPWIEQLEQKLNNILRDKKIAESEIEQVIIYGKEIETIDYLLSSWLQKKLPGVTTIMTKNSQEKINLIQGLTNNLDYFLLINSI